MTSDLYCRPLYSFPAGMAFIVVAFRVWQSVVLFGRGSDNMEEHNCKQLAVLQNKSQYTLCSTHNRQPIRQTEDTLIFIEEKYAI